MSLKKRSQTFISSLLATVQRFPIPVLFSLLFCIIAVGATEHKIPKTPIAEISLPILLIGCLWFTALKLYAESQGWKLKYYAVGIPIFLLIAWYLYLSSFIFLPFYFLGAGLFLSIFIAPFLNKQASSMQLWVFNCRLLTHICLTIMSAIVLYLGLVFIVESLRFLFRIQLSNTIHEDMVLIVATFFSPILALEGIPERFDTVEEIYPKTIRFILSYIALPLLFIYAVILYGYTAKILFMWELPKGEVTGLVSLFGCIGTTLYLVSYPLHQSQGIINLFSRYFFLILLVPLVLFAIGIGVRVHEYGMTEGRYAVLLCLVWLVLSVCFGFAKQHIETPKFIFMSLIFLLLSASFGPWGAIHISTWSQLSRLENILKKDQVLVNNHIHASSQIASQADGITISAIMDYIVSTKKTDHIRPWFDDLPNAYIFKQQQGDYTAKAIVQDMGIKYLKSDGYFRYQQFQKQPVRITGYDYLVNVNDIDTKQRDFTREITLGDANAISKLSISFSSTENICSVTLLETNEKLLFPLEELIEKLDIDGSGDHVAENQPIIERESPTLAVRLIINTIYYRFEKNNEKPTITPLDFSLLVKRK